MASITIPATDGAGGFEAFMAEPAATPAGAVVLIQEIFGVNDAMRAAAAFFADLGFFVLVPDLFWRIRPGIVLSADREAEFKEALSLGGRFDQERGIDDLKATLRAARVLPGANGRAGTVGYCLGGRLAFLMAQRSDADVNISYYGVGLDGLLGGLAAVRNPLLVHIAGEDGFFPAEGRARVIEAAKANDHVHAYNYEGADHAFARPGGAHWQGMAAAIANGRSAEALRAALA